MASGLRKFTSTHMCQRSKSRRRSIRRILNPRNKTKPSQDFFEKLPHEVFNLILDHLTAVETSVFSMVSKNISSYIRRHVTTLSWRNQMILQRFHCTSESATLEHFRCLGLLFKRCTLLLPTKDRLRFACNAFSLIPCVMMENCASLPYCQGFTYYGAFLKTLIAGWDELECSRVFKFLCETSNIQHKIESAVTCKPGECHRLELVIRFFCRGVLLDERQSRQDSLFWLTCILKPWPIVSQAYLLFVLFGPLQSDGRIGWQDVCEHVVEQDGLWDLAKAIILLHGPEQTKSWNADTILTILDEMMVMPQPWLMENMARLLLMCGNSVCYNVLANKAVRGRLVEISRLLIFLILVSEKDGYCMKWAVKMTQQVCKLFSVASEKWTFIQSVENMFSEVTMELCELIMAANQNGDMDLSQRLCSLLNASAHFHTEVVYKSLCKD